MHSVVGSSPVSEASTLWMQQMARDPDTHLQWIDGLRQFALDCGGVCKIGTLFSGTDVVMKVLNVHSAYWKHAFGIELRFEHAFAAEKNPSKQEFLREHAKVPVLFGDANDVLGNSAINLITNERVSIPWVHWLIAGFPCTSKSKANNHRGKNKTCVRDGTGATGAGSKLIEDYVSAMQPIMLTLENVPEFLNGKAGETDADLLVQRIQEKGYWVLYFPFDCLHYGSKSHRDRLYWHGRRGRVARPNAAAKFARLLKLMRLDVDEFELSRFLNVDAEGQAREDKLDMPPVKLMELEDSGMGYKDDHNEYFRASGMQYPIQLDALCPQRYVLDGMTDRAQEIAYFLDQRFPVPVSEVQDTRFDFVDVASSLDRLMKVKPTQDKVWFNPWQTTFPTMTGVFLFVISPPRKHFKVCNSNNNRPHDLLHAPGNPHWRLPQCEPQARQRV